MIQIFKNLNAPVKKVTYFVMILKPSSVNQTQLLGILWEYQLKKGYISEAEIRQTSKKLDIPVGNIRGVISFYHFFHTKPSGKYTIYVNNSIISEMKGFREVMNTFEKETGAEIGGVDPTGTFGLFETSCIGLSDQEPAALINFRPFVNLTTEKVKEIVSDLRNRKKIDNLADTVKDHLRFDLGDRSIFIRDYNRGEIVQKAMTMNRFEIVEDLIHSGLTGRGGAFFPTGLKWDIARKEFSDWKFVICNADEGEPGTFKDRFLLNNYPGLILEGMILCAYVTGANKGFIYLRAEYRYLKEKLEKEIEEFINLGLLGDNIRGLRGFEFDISVEMGAGAYVCGEETALIESLEGKRGEPRTKTFFPVKSGLLFKPTIVNNVETFSSAARIIEIGAKTYREMGTEKSTGSKLISISGDCEKPGIYEIEWGMKISELLTECGAKDTAFVQLSGPSGKLASKKDFDKCICGEEFSCGGSFMVFNSKRDMWDVLTNFNNFFIDESCGLCTPCRTGNYQIGKLIKKIRKGRGNAKNLDDLKQWADIVEKTSRCGLGKTSNNFVLDMFDKFPNVLRKPIEHNNEAYNRGFNLEESLIDYSDFVKKIQENG